MTHPMKQVPDMISTTGKFVNMSSGLPSPANMSNGDWYYNNETKQLTYIVSGKGEWGLVNQNVKMLVSILTELYFITALNQIVCLFFIHFMKSKLIFF